MSWLEPLIDSGALLRAAQRDKHPRPEAGLALLLENRLALYEFIRKRTDWPALGREADRRSNDGIRLLAAVGMHLTGNTDARRRYLKLTRSDEPSLAAIATLLLAFFDSDTGRRTAAVRLLRRRIADQPSSIAQSLLSIQLGVRLGEDGEFLAAIDASRTAIALGKSAPSAWRKLLEAIARHNIAHFAQRVRLHLDPAQLPSRDQPALNRADTLEADSLSRYLEESFDASLRQPYARSIIFQREDPVEVGLRAALIRSELLGDWPQLKRSRALLGRYFVLSKLGTAPSVPPAAFELLRRGGDAKGLRAAARTIRRMGPLTPLRVAASALIEGAPLMREEPAASLTLVAEGADVLSERLVARAIDSLLTQKKAFLRNWDTAAGALAALTRVGPSKSQTPVARFTRELTQNESHAGVIQDAARVVAAIRWLEVDSVERARWLAEIRDTLGTPTNRNLVAERAVSALAAAERGEITEILTSKFETSPSLDLLAMWFDVVGRLPRRFQARAWELVAASLAASRNRAASGITAFGALDVGQLAAVYLTHQRQPAHWNELLTYLLDPEVASDDKAGALGALARPDIHLPAPIRSQLAEQIHNITGREFELGPPRDSFLAARLTLAARLGAVGKEDLVTGILELAGGVEAESRIEAARVVAATHRRVGAVVATTIVSMLTKDANHDVRAAAGHALAQFGESRSPALTALRRERLETLLSEPGTVVPAGVLSGLYRSWRSGLTIDGALMEQIDQLAIRHESWAVRDAAATVARAIVAR